MDTSNGSTPGRTVPGVASGQDCPKCGVFVLTGTKFCGSCGHRMPAEVAFDVETRVGPRPGGAQGTPSAGLAGAPGAQGAQGSGKAGRSTLFFGGAVQSARAKLTLIRGDGEDGVSFTLAGQEHPAGRGECPISFPDDPFLSPTHANFLYRGRDLVVRDEGSLNGIYVRIQGAVNLVSGATVLIGEQVLQVSAARQVEDTPDTEGTFYSASMPRPANMEVRQHLRGGALGWVFRVEAEALSIGREGNDVNFPDDPFISGRHAELRISGGVLSVTDLGSRNGTFVRVNGEQVLRHGDYVFLGQQLLRVEIV